VKEQLVHPFLLASLVATTGITLNQPPSSKTASAAVDQRPALVKTIDGLRERLDQWREWARTETNRHDQSSATSSAPPLPPSTRRPL
jgi:hypothetical protein